MIKKLGEFYLWFWYHTEFWLTKINRRPYTFIMRDWIFRHTNVAFILVLSWFALLIGLAHIIEIWTVVLAILTAFLLGHLVWGSAWIEHQQEKPDYLPDLPENHKGKACLIKNIICQEGFCAECEIYKKWLNNAS
jgi:hypothetical protein